jgi:hypothetical protein
MKIKPSVTQQMIEYYHKWLETARQMKMAKRRETAPTLTF